VSGSYPDSQPDTRSDQKADPRDVARLATGRQCTLKAKAEHFFKPEPAGSCMKRAV
jgi:hypothetical protein